MLGKMLRFVLWALCALSIQSIAAEPMLSRIRLPPGFKIELFADQLPNARVMVRGERGTIFVTLGLLAKLKNQSELAFILAHEISHVVSSHNMHMYIEVNKIKRKKRTKNVLAERDEIKSNDLLKKCLFAKDLESEADSLGAIRYLQAGYKASSIDGVFDVLASSNLPFSDLPFQYTLLESPKLIIRDSLKKFKTADAIQINEQENDSLNTHPAILKRRTQVKGIVGRSTSSSNSVVMDEQKFQQVKRIAQFELPLLHILDQQFPSAIYLSAILLKEFPSNIYLKKCLAKALYLQTKYINLNGSSSVDHKKITGSLQSVYHMLEYMGEVDLNKIAAHYVWDLSNRYPDDDELSSMKKDMQMEYAVHMNWNKKDSATKRANNPFADLLSHEECDKLLTTLGAKHKAASAHPAPNNIRKSKSFGVSSLLVLPPEYISFDNRGESHVEFLRSEEGRARMEEMLTIAAKKSGVQIQPYSMENGNHQQVENFNEIRQLKDWLNEQSANSELTSTVGSNQQEINKLLKKYNTKYALLSGIVSIHQPNFTPFLLPLSALFWPTLPFTVAASVKPAYQMLYYAVLADLSTGDMKVVSLNYFRKRDSDAMMKAHLYHTLRQIKKKARNGQSL